MKNLTLSALLITSSLSAISLSEVINKSLVNSPSLESINAKIQANVYATDVANQFSNPELSLTKNSIDSSQAMSQTVLTIKQKLPYYGKRDSRQNITLAEDLVLKEKLNSAKARMVAKIKTEAYSIWELKELYKIINEYITLTKQNIELYEAYTSVDANQHMGIMKAELSLADLEIQKSVLNAKIYASYAKLSYLAAFDVKNLEINLKIAQKPNLDTFVPTLVNNPELLIKDKELKKEHAKIEVADLNNYPDINLIAGYSYRENFDNYFNFGLALSLPMYGTEDAQEEEVRASALSIVSQKEDTQIAISSQLKIYYAQMLSSYEIYHIIQDDALPQIAHMFELSNSSISTGGDLFKYIDVLFDKLALEQKSINAVSNYNKANAQISQLAGEIK
ncbi:TolC family protein [Sulfurimonas sp. SAG-AH-194-C21]|nr:TolC family protein [Sulfurimonas sp. SAG-AH-194-C21]MDF1883110.1 TolC family protein [Sulfurimonas sp. SAG-AH-194-C21]